MLLGLGFRSGSLMTELLLIVNQGLFKGVVGVGRLCFQVSLSHSKNSFKPLLCINPFNSVQLSNY